MKSVLIEQNPHWQGKFYKSIKRDKLDKLISYLPLKQIITISGIRRCGKSTLVKQAINYLIQNRTNPKNILFLNLEHPFFLEFKSNPNYLNTIFEEYLKLIDPKGKIYCVFDEIQYFQNWQVYIKNRYENSDIKYIITGSNSTMLSNELNTLLSGRGLNIHLDTFSFTEFLDYKQIPYEKSEFDRLSYKIEISRAKDEYLKWGGFYEVFNCEDETIKKDILISYAKNIIYQDIVPRYNIRNSLIVERLFFYLLSTTTGVLNYTTLSKTFEISDKTIKEYINYFEDVFLFKRIDKYHTKQKEQIKSSKKLYVLDNGFLQIAPKFLNNFGTTLENSIFNILKSNENLTYLRDKKEIDFYTKDTLYQVSYDIDDAKTLKRELSAFNHFDFKDTNKLLITYDTNDKIDDIEIISFEDFIFKKGI
jgi:predicted AAA+ superfamily ATPase